MPVNRVPLQWGVGLAQRVDVFDLLDPEVLLLVHPQGVQWTVHLLVLDSELNALALGTKETQKAIKSLKEMNVKVDRTIHVSDSQTCLSLCSRPSSTLDRSTSLIVSRVQDVWFPHLDNLYFAPGTTFSQSVDLLTRFRMDFASLITDEFYSPSWMVPEIED